VNWLIQQHMIWYHDRPRRPIVAEVYKVRKEPPWRICAKATRHTQALIVRKFNPRVNLQDDLSLVLSEVGMMSVASIELRRGSAQSCSFLISPGIKDINENCIMHSFSQFVPKKSICLVSWGSHRVRGDLPWAEEAEP
jgi:hypothetical protein